MEIRFRDRLFPTAFSKNFFAAQRQLKYYSIFYFWYASSGVQFTQKSTIYAEKFRIYTEVRSHIEKMVTHPLLRDACVFTPGGTGEKYYVVLF